MKKYRAVTHGNCKDCGLRYNRGDWIVRIATAQFVHLDCPEDF